MTCVDIFDKYSSQFLHFWAFPAHSTTLEVDLGTPKLEVFDQNPLSPAHNIIIIASMAVDALDGLRSLTFGSKEFGVGVGGDYTS